MVDSNTALPLSPRVDNEATDHSQLRVVPRDIFARVSSLLDSAVDQGVFPGVVLVVGKNGQDVYKKATGYHSTLSHVDEAPRRAGFDSVYDLASLTQIVTTTTLLMKLLDTGSITLEDRVSRYLQCFSVHGKSKITIGHLLAHCSGLPAWHPYYEELLKQHSASRMGIMTSRGAKEFVYNALNRFQVKTEPGLKSLYSDLGFIVLGNIVEVLTGASLQRSTQRLLCKPLGLESTSFIDLAMLKRRGLKPVAGVVAPTEDCPWRRRVMCGEVHDDNAWAMGGVSGHAGLFSTAEDLHIFAQEMLRAFYGHHSLVSSQTIRRFWSRAGYVPESPFCLGWHAADRSADLLNCGFSPSAVGQDSFTGCSLWLDPESASSIVLLSNRVHPSRNNKKIHEFRKQLFSTINEALR